MNAMLGWLLFEKLFGVLFISLSLPKLNEYDESIAIWQEEEETLLPHHITRLFQLMFRCYRIQVIEELRILVHNFDQKKVKLI
jgi:hypothetical protein